MNTKKIFLGTTAILLAVAGAFATKTANKAVTKVAATTGTGHRCTLNHVGKQCVTSGTGNNCVNGDGHRYFTVTHTGKCGLALVTTHS